MATSGLSILYSLICLRFAVLIYGRLCFCSHFIVREIESSRTWVTSPKSITIPSLVKTMNQNTVFVFSIYRRTGVICMMAASQVMNIPRQYPFFINVGLNSDVMWHLVDVLRIIFLFCYYLGPFLIWFFLLYMCYNHSQWLKCQVHLCEWRTSLCIFFPCILDCPWNRVQVI